MTLTGPQRRKLVDALEAAFPSPEELEKLVSYCLTPHLRTLPLGKTVEDIILAMVRKAESDGWLELLIREAHALKPGNQRLAGFYQEWTAGGIPSTDPSPEPVSTPVQADDGSSIQGATVSLAGVGAGQAQTKDRLERLIRAASGFIDIGALMARLPALVLQICRIEIPRLDGDIEFGTGFLVGPDVVMTNYHVLGALFDGEAVPDKVRMRFDLQSLEDGVSEREGTVYGLEDDDWLLDSSPDAPDGKPTADTLDYALLRLDRQAGLETVGGSGTSGMARGWVRMPSPVPRLKSGAPLFILQHPQAEPLKLAFEQQGVLAVLHGGRLVRYAVNTEEGSSGSPCFNRNWDLVALHHSGDPNFAPDHHPVYNAGTPIAAILASMKANGTLHLLGG